MATAKKPAKSACKLSCCAISDERKAEIAASAEASRGKSMFDVEDSSNMDRFHGAMCRCGVDRKPAGLARMVADDGLCTAHPNKPPQKWVRGAG